MAWQYLGYYTATGVVPQYHDQLVKRGLDLPFELFTENSQLRRDYADNVSFISTIVYRGTFISQAPLLPAAGKKQSIKELSLVAKRDAA